MQKEIERHIITKNSHKITSYGGFEEITQGLMSHEEITEFLEAVIAEEKEEHRKRTRRRSAKSLNAKSDKFPRNARERKIFQDYLMSSVEYSGLLRVSRPFQTDDSGVPGIKKMEEIFVDMFKYVEKCHEDFRKAYEDEKREALDDVYQKMRARLDHHQKKHEQAINRIRRCYRSRMSDIASQISVEAKSELVENLETQLKVHKTELSNYKESIQHTKRSIQKTADDMVKLRGQITRYQIQLKRNGLLDAETAALLDDKGKADNFLGGLQQTEEAKLKKKAELEQGLLLLEQICDAVEQGVLPENIPTYINSIRGGHRISSFMDRPQAASIPFFNNATPRAGRFSVSGPRRESSVGRESLSGRRESTVPGRRESVSSSLQESETSMLMDLQDVESKNAEIIAKKKKEYNRKIEQMRTEIQELHERFEEKFDELKNSGSRVAGSEKMKKKAVQQWGIDLNQSTYSMSKGNLLANTEKLSSKMTTKTADQSLFCDLNGRAGFFNYL